MMLLCSVLAAALLLAAPPAAAKPANVLVVYFSHSNHTKSLGEAIGKVRDIRYNLPDICDKAQHLIS